MLFVHSLTHMILTPTSGWLVLLYQTFDTTHSLCSPEFHSCGRLSLPSGTFCFTRHLQCGRDQRRRRLESPRQLFVGVSQPGARPCEESLTKPAISFSLFILSFFFAHTLLCHCIYIYTNTYRKVNRWNILRWWTIAARSRRNG